MNEDISALEKKAVEAALNEFWEQSIGINKTILRQDAKNIAALNRLALGLSKLGNYPDAKKCYQQVLEIDSLNPIALKNLLKLDGSTEVKLTRNVGKKLTCFLEEPGKTKVVKLVRLAADETLGNLIPGQQVFFLSKKRTISIIDEQNSYLGTIPDDLSLRLLELMNGGNQYEVFVKSQDKQNLFVFIRETFRSDKFHNQPSFSASSVATMAYLDDKPIAHEMNFDDDSSEN